MTGPVLPLSLQAAQESLPLAEPFRITGWSYDAVDVVVARLARGGHAGRGEAAGVDYLGDDPPAILRQLEHSRDAISRLATRTELQSLLPPGGARNALDCALWELESLESGRPVAALAGFARTRPLLTTWTLSADEPARMAAKAVRFAGARALKLKLLGDGDDAARVRAVRAARPDAWLAVDANQGLVPATLAALVPCLVDARVALVEQPYKVGQEVPRADLPVPRAIQVAADESIQHLGDLESLAGCFDVVNIKLDKCGGLTEGLAMARRARALGLVPMVGNMLGSSLAMAPAWLVGQLCDVVDLDGPLLLARDREPGVAYRDGMIECAGAVWGAADGSGAT